MACIIKSKTYGTCISLKPPRTGQLQLVTFSLDYSSKHYSFAEPVILRFPDSCAEPIAITGFGFSLFIDSGSLDSLRIFSISSRYVARAVVRASESKLRVRWRLCYTHCTDTLLCDIAQCPAWINRNFIQNGNREPFSLYVSSDTAVGSCTYD